MQRQPSYLHSSSPDDETIIPAFAAVIRSLRLQHGFTQEQLAWRTNVDQSFISALERGLKEPCLKTIVQLASAFDLPLSQLIIAFEQQRKQHPKS
ncbi:MAG: helix-turn-helix transcriptional regulator [Chlorobi bacterium]|nr:helix-turn-helix transcriptional regulator [Chlorobiota bacterium]